MTSFVETRPICVKVPNEELKKLPSREFNPKMKGIDCIPNEIVFHILAFSSHIKERNGKPVFQIMQDDPRINMLVKRYTRDRTIDYPYDTSRFVVRFLNDNHYIRSSYTTLRGVHPGEPRFRQAIRIVVIKFERFKNGKMKKNEVDKYFHVIDRE